MDARGRGRDEGAHTPARLRSFISPLVERESEVHGFTPAEVRELMAGIYSRGDRLMLRFLLAHALVALALALFFDTWLTTLLTSSAAVGAFVLSVKLWPRSFFTRCMAGISTQTFVALHIYQLHGLAEMHFFFFTGFTMMLVYQDGLSMWPGAWLIIGQHIIFAWLHNAGVPLHFFEVQHITVTRLFFHFGIALVQVGICAYWSVLLRRQTLRDAWQKARLHETGSQLAEQRDTIRESEAALRMSARALNESMRRQRDILDNIPDLAWLKGKDGRYLAVNATFLRTFRTKASDVIGRVDDDFFPETLVARLTELDARVRDTRQAARFEARYVDSSGAWRDIDTIVTPIADGVGELAGTMGIARDITDRMLAEAERERLHASMRRTQKFESLGVLAGGIAHDFNNLLVGVIGNVGMARQLTTDSADLSAMLADAEHGALRAAELTQQLLAYAGRGQFVVRRVDLSALVRETTVLLGSAVSKKAALTFDLATELPSTEADATQIRQVIMNLVTNASEALGGGPGTIELTTRVGEYDSTDLASFRGADGLSPGRFVALSVRDSGSGMDERTVERIFDPFFTTKFTGRGLGLAAVLGIARAHAGGMKVESAPGVGSMFTLILPAADGAAVASTTGTESGGVCEFTGLRVLIVDDDTMVRNVGARILAREGLDVGLAEDGVEALEVLQSSGGTIHAVLLDILMPRMDGIETLREITNRWPELGVVMSSGFTETEATQRLRGLSFAGFLHKPYTPEQLIAAMRRALVATTTCRATAAPGPHQALSLRG